MASRAAVAASTVRSACPSNRRRVLGLRPAALAGRRACSTDERTTGGEPARWAANAVDGAATNEPAGSGPLGEPARDPAAHLTNGAGAVEREHVGDRPVEERAVVADHDERSGPVVAEVLQRPQGVEIEIVGGLVEQQDVRGLAIRVSSSCRRRRSPPDRVPMGAHWASPSNQNRSMSR